MAGLAPKPTLKERAGNIVWHWGGVNRIPSYLRAMRCSSYYSNYKTGKPLCRIKRLYYAWKFHRLSQRLGFSIGKDVFGYGLLLPHYGTVVVGGENVIGNYAVIHTSTCIGGKNRIGNAFYLSAGSKVFKNITLGDNISVAGNSLVDKPFDGNLLLGGNPARILRGNYPEWYVRDGESFKERVQRIENLKIKMGV